MGPAGTRSDLYEPGACVVYAAPDGARRTGIVDSQSNKWVRLRDGTAVRKDRVLGADDTLAGKRRRYRVTLHHASGTRTSLVVAAATGAEARERAQDAADRVMPGWTAKGVRTA